MLGSQEQVMDGSVFWKVVAVQTSINHFVNDLKLGFLSNVKHVHFQNMLIWPSTFEFQPCNHINHDFGSCRLIFFGGYGYAAQGPHRGNFEFDEFSLIGVCKCIFNVINTFLVAKIMNLLLQVMKWELDSLFPVLECWTEMCLLLLQWDGPGRGWNNHIHILDLETSTWSQPITTVRTCRETTNSACHSSNIDTHTCMR